MKDYDFSKRVLAFLLERAKGARSWRKFALDCDVSYVQMRKLAMLGQENPPRQRLLEKVAAHSENGVELGDLMFAAGYARAVPQSAKEDAAGREKDAAFSRFFAKYGALRPRQRRDIEAFADCLLRLNSEGAEDSEKK